MANKDRQKRSARKARAAERKELEEKHAASQVNAPKKAAPAQATASAKKAAPKKKHFARIRGWFADVKSEMHRVTWPSKSELKNYSVAVIVMLVCAAANGVVNGATEGLGAVVFQLLRGFEASAVAVVVTFVLAPVYLVLLRRRDEQGNDTSGLALQTVALVLAAVVFVGVALALASPVLG